MDLDEMAAELNAIKASNQQRDFLDKYGTQFNMSSPAANFVVPAVLSELNRRGALTPEAEMAALQEVMDSIRMEATSVLDAINVQQNAVSGLMNKVNAVEQSVAAATGVAPGSDLGAPQAPPATEAMGPAPTDMSMPPPEAMGPAPTDMGVSPPPPAPEASLPPEQMLSDAHLKLIKNSIQPKPAAKPVPSYKPSKATLLAIQGRTL